MSICTSPKLAQNKRLGGKSSGKKNANKLNYNRFTNENSF